MGLSKEHLNTYEFYLSCKDVPTGWEVVSLDDVSFVVTDGTHKTPEYKDKGIRFISIKNIRPYLPINWNSYEKYISHQEHNTLIKRCHPKRDDILFPRVGTLGFAKRIDFDEEVSIFVGLGLIQPVKNCILPKFLEYYMNTPYVNRLSTKRAKGTGRKTLPLEESRRFPVPVAPLVEQRRIVSKIDELFSELTKGVEYLKTAREQLKVYRQAVLKHAFKGKLTEQWREENKHKLEPPEQLLARIKKERNKRHQQQFEEWNIAVRIWEMEGKKGKKPKKPGTPKQFKVITSDETESLPKISSTWRFVRLSEIAEIGLGMSVNLSRKISDPVKVAYLRVANVQRGFLNLSEVKHMTIEKSQLDRLALKQWDILFNEGGDRDKLGRGWIWQSKITPCITQNHVFRASPYLPSKEQSTLISHWGNTFGQRYFEEMGKQTTNLASINKTVLSDFPVPLMSFEEQEELCKQLDRMMTFVGVQLDEISVGLEKARTLRQAILLAAFSGGLTQQDPNDEPASILLERIRTEKAMQKGTNKENNRGETAAAIP